MRLGLSVGAMGSWYRNLTTGSSGQWAPTGTAELVIRNDQGEFGVFYDNTFVFQGGASAPQQNVFWGIILRGFVANKSKGGPTIALKFDPLSFWLLAAYSGALSSRPIWDYLTGVGFELGYRPAAKMIAIQPTLSIRYFYWPYPSIFASTWNSFLTGTQRQLTLDAGIRLSI